MSNSSNDKPEEKKASGELRQVIIDRNPSGYPISIPAEVSEAKLDQYVKRFIEIADYNPQDGSGVVARFRLYHGGTWTLRILEAVLEELRHPSIHLDIKTPRERLVPFFEWVLARHRTSSDADFGYPPDPARRAILPD
jgi:hypothetical protein